MNDKYFETAQKYFDILQAGCGGQTANKDLLCPHHQLRVGLSWNSNLKKDVVDFIDHHILSLLFNQELH